MRASHTLVALAAPLSLHVQLGTCVVYSADTRAAASVACQLGVRHAPDGLLSTGTPVGTPASQAAQADCCANRAYSLMDDLQALPLAHQDCWILLQGTSASGLPVDTCGGSCAAVQRASG
jgi:hypothetical protein